MASMAARALLVIAFGLLIEGHTILRRDVDELLQPKHVHNDDVNMPNSQQENVSRSAPQMKENSVGYSLIQNNNPYLPGEKRGRQAFKVPPNGICNPDQICTEGPYRSFDGSCNNLKNPGWGQAGVPFRRLLQPRQSLIRCGLNSGSRLPNPRLASWVLNDRFDDDAKTDKSMMVMVFGQAIDHDITMTPLRRTPDEGFLDCCDPRNMDAPDCCPIIMPDNDPFYSVLGRINCIPLIRSELTSPPGSQCRRRPDVANANTAFIDASFLYGSDPDRAASLRTMSKGQLKTTQDNRNRVFPHISTDRGFRMDFGDTRGDVHPAFTLLLTTFLRNHNRIASTLAGFHPDWSDEILFQETRKITIALLQHFTYSQFIDSLLGEANDIKVRANDPNPRDFYNPQTDPTITLPFSTASYRLHTYVGGSFFLANRDFQKTGELRLRDVYHKPLTLLTNNNYDDLLRGLIIQPVWDYNNVFTTEMTEWLFKENNKDFGHDIVALNVQRGRDHQIPGYPAYKRLCGLGNARSWPDLADSISSDLIGRLQQLYQRPEDIDLYIGQNMETTVPGSLLGPTAHCIVRDQFKSLRDGDRFFYTRPNQFTPAQLAAIKRTTLARLLCDNADQPSTLRLPLNVFKMAQGSNPAISCSDTFNLPELDLSPWK